MGDVVPIRPPTNEVLIARLRGLAPVAGTPETDRDPRNPNGNGARGALIEVGLTLPDTNEIDAAIWTDWLLMELWSRGFMVVALPDNVS